MGFARRRSYVHARLLLTVVAGAALALLTLWPALASDALHVSPAPPVACEPALTGTAGNDTIVGTAGDDHICGGDGNDVLLGMGGQDILEGEGGNDYLRGGPGDDDVQGGTETDTIAHPDDPSGTGKLTVALSGTAAACSGTPCAHDSDGGLGDDTLSSIENVLGSPFDDTILGSAGSNVLNGLAGTDTLRGAGAADRVYGENGSDRVLGGGGNDILVGGPGADRGNGGGGNDAVAGGDQNDTIQGFDGADVLVGGPGNDVQLGDASADQIRGQDGTSGNDTVDGKRGTDTCNGDAGDTVLGCEALLGANTAPTVADDPATGVEADFSVSDEGMLFVAGPGVLGNDTDADGEALSASMDSAPANGTVTLFADGSFLYDPTDTFSGTDTFTYTASDGTANSAAATVSVEVVASNLPPDAVDDTATTNEDTLAIINVLSNDTDPDGDTLEITNVTDPANGTTSIAQGTPDQISYTPDLDYCNDPPGTTSDTFTYTIDDGNGETDTATVSVTVDCVNDAPVADDETFNGANGAIGNTALVVNDPDDGAPSQAGPKKTITGDILAGDSDVDGPGPLAAVPGTVATNDGGSVTIEADGDFTFFPAASTSCTDSSDFFDYTVSDQNPGTAGTDTGRVTISIAGCVWYVNNNATGNSGTSAAPFDTLAQAETASGASHTVFVFDGDNTTTGYDTGFQMNSGERLIGEHEGLTVDPDGGGSLGAETLHPVNPGAHPTLTATNEDVVALDDGNEVRGFNLDPQGASGGIAGASGDTGGGIIDDVNVVDSGTAGTEPGLELDSTLGTFNVSNLVVNNTGAVGGGAVGVRLNNAGTVNFASTGQISITAAGAQGLDATSTNMGSGSVFDDITVTHSPSGGVSMVNTTGTTTFGDGVGTDLSLVTTSGMTAAFRLNSAGTVMVGAAGSDGVHATGGPAIDVTGTSGATLEFDDVDSTNSANDGINLDGLATGTFSASSGDIAGAAGISFDLNGGSGSITYPGNFGNGSGTTAIDVTGRSGGVVSLSGPISDTNDAGGGLNVSSNTGGSTVLSATTKQFNTGASDAVSYTTSDGHSLTLSGGGLDIDTSSGKGINATTSGTLQVSGGLNTINTGTGTGLNVQDTNIDSGGLTFQSISVNDNGAAATGRGIVLDNTGTSGADGSLTVTGDGSNADNGSGGSIENLNGADGPTGLDGGTGFCLKTSNPFDGVGIFLSNTKAPTFRSMNLTDFQNFGILGFDITNGFELTGMSVTATAPTFVGTNAGTDDGPVHFCDVSGTATISNLSATRGLEDNFVLQNDSATLSSLSVSNSTFSNTSSSSPGNNGFLIRARGTGNVTASFTGANTFSNNFANGLQAATENSGVIDLTINGGTFSSNNIGINLSNNASPASATTNFSFDVLNASITGNVAGTSASPINIFTGTLTNANTTMSGTLSGNTIDNNGSAVGPGINVGNNGGSRLIIAITNNLITDVGNTLATNLGISLIAGNGAPDMDATITGNNVTVAGDFTQGILVNKGTSLATDDPDVCAKIGGATAAEENTVSATGTGSDDVRVRNRQGAAAFVLTGYSGGATDTTAVANHLIATNNIVDASATNTPAAGFVGGACTTPT